MTGEEREAGASGALSRARSGKRSCALPAPTPALSLSPLFLSFLFSLASFLLLLAGCAPSADPADPAEAGPIVARFFGAIEESDCQALRELSWEVTGERECQELVESFQKRGMRLLEILSAKVDGRAKDAVIVKTRVFDAGQPKERLFRVEKQSGTWKVRL